MEEKINETINEKNKIKVPKCCVNCASHITNGGTGEYCDGCVLPSLEDK